MMNLLYVSRLCSRIKFDEIFVSSKIKPPQQAQKFNSLLVNGLSGTGGTHVTALCDLPVTGASHSRIWWKRCSDFEGPVKYIHTARLNMGFAGRLFGFMAVFLETAIWCLHAGKNGKYLICDVLSLTASISARMAAVLFGAAAIAVVTDIPDYLGEYTRTCRNRHGSLTMMLYTRICNFLIHTYDAYVVLTEQMNDVINPLGKPHIIVEGMVDHHMKDTISRLDDKFKENVVIYAGALYEKYGVKKLIDGFCMLAAEDARLWLFGSGDLEPYIAECMDRDSRISYFGTIPNDDVVKMETRACLLVNPRPSDAVFAKYSFPSKNMEYLASGTPLLSAPLPCMPREYLEYIYVLDDETEKGICKKLGEIISLPAHVRHRDGILAREFVLMNKTNIIQAARVKEFLMSLHRHGYCSGVDDESV